MWGAFDCRPAPMVTLRKGNYDHSVACQHQEHQAGGMAAGLLHISLYLWPCMADRLQIMISVMKDALKLLRL